MNKPNMEPAGINDDPMAAERELHLAELTRQALDEGYQAVEVALGPDGVRALVEERNTAQARVGELEKYIGELPFCETCGGAGGLAAYRIDSLQIMVHRYADEVKELQSQLANEAKCFRAAVDEGKRLEEQLARAEARAFDYEQMAGETSLDKIKKWFYEMHRSNETFALARVAHEFKLAEAEARGEALAKELADFKRWLDKESAFLSKDDLVATLIERAEAAEAQAATLLPVTEASLKYFEALEKGASLSEQQRLWLLWDCAVIKYRAALAPKENK